MDVFPAATTILHVVGQDASTEATFSCLAAALNSLLSTADSVFSKIEGRVALERSRLDAVNSRLERVKTKVALIGSSTKAVTMFATPKYPALDVARHSLYATLHDGIFQPLQDPAAAGELAPINAALLDKATLQPDDEVLTRPEKRAALLDLLATVSMRGRAAAGNIAGLGQLPSYLPSVCSTLLFNSRARPYREQRTLEELITREEEDAGESLLRTDRERKANTAGRSTVARTAARKEEELRRLGSAPQTLVEGDTLPALAAVEYAYKPRMRDMQAFALPSNLALPNVADISWQASVSSIAPTVVKADEPVLPTILDLMPPPPPVPAFTTPAVPSSVPPAPTTLVPAALPPPPGMPSVAPPPMPATAPLPPPPPPPAAVPLPVVAAVDLPASPPARNDLLAALNNPDNIRKLKKAQSTSTSKDSEEAAPAKAAASSGSSGGGDMMAEMAKRLAMRRKAMGGDTDAGSKATAAKSAAAPTAISSPGPADSGVFRPESMHGFKLSSSSKASKKRKDSDDWGESDDED